MQAASDIYLGWTKGRDLRRHFCWRQLRDMKGSALVEAMTPLALGFYAGICGVNPGPGARPFRGPGRPGRLPGRKRCLRTSAQRGRVQSLES
jgi:uncharacterized protein DUF2252